MHTACSCYTFADTYSIAFSGLGAADKLTFAAIWLVGHEALPHQCSSSLCKQGVQLQVQGLHRQHHIQTVSLISSFYYGVAQPQGPVSLHGRICSLSNVGAARLQSAQIHPYSEVFSHELLVSLG